MGNKSTLSPDIISAAHFAAYLAKYEQCIEAISKAKGAAKPGRKLLADLDKYRYEEATATFGGGKPQRTMELDDVKTLVDWKLRHGKFRPALMKLVSSNDPDFVKDTVQECLKGYKADSDVPKALDVLTKLKGIGPATASLLLAVHDPERVIFFADEAFYWLCCKGKKESIKYDAKEYKSLTERARKVCKRLGVRAVDVEKVAFAIMKRQKIDLPASSATRTGVDESTKEKKDTKTNIKQSKKVQPAKRKASSGEDDTEVNPPKRRSRRAGRRGYY